MNIDLPKEIIELSKKFQDAGFMLYAVGGVVRDLLLKKEPKDWDFTTDATPDQILKIIPEGFYNNQFGTVGISASLLDNSYNRQIQLPTNEKRDNEQTNNEIYEITTMRKESGYFDSRHPDNISWTKNVEEDLGRRDFTVNGMAMNLANWPVSELASSLIVDPFGGQADLQNKIIRAVGDPNKRFQEDALRLMRAIRFATQLQFSIEEKTFKALKDKAQLIQNISWERIRDELFKILASENSYQGIITLRETGLLQFILPELERCFGVVQKGPKHDRIYDIGEHSFLSLKFCPSANPLIRFATLIHDIGKPDTYKVEADGNATFYGHDVVGASIAKKVAERLRLSKKEIEKVWTLVRYHMFTVDEHQTDSAIRRFIKNIGFENVADMFALRVGDRLGGGTETETSWRMENFKKRITEVMTKPFGISDLKVNGSDVMEILKLKPSPKVGEVLQTLFEEVVEDSSKNEREYLLDRIRRLTIND